MAVRRRSKPPAARRPSCIVSACLAGISCTYRGGSKLRPHIASLVAAGRAIPVCPEIMGGLTTPRENAEIVGGEGIDVIRGRARVLSASGRDLSAAYLRGAREILILARRRGITTALLKSKSPACGCGTIYDGSFRRILRPGNGVLAALLLMHGISVRTETSSHST